VRVTAVGAAAGGAGGSRATANPAPDCESVVTDEVALGSVPAGAGGAGPASTTSRAVSPAAMVGGAATIGGSETSRSIGGSTRAAGL